MRLRVLHLVDPESPGGGPCILRWLAEIVRRLDAIDHEVLVIGSRAHARLAQDCGLRTIGFIARRGRSSDNLRAVIREHERSRSDFDIVHSWSPRAAVIALSASAPRLGSFFLSNGSRARPQAHRHVATVAVCPDRYSDISALDDAQMLSIAAFDRLRSDCVRSGLLRSRTVAIPPAIDPEAIENSRDVLRSRWEVDDETFIIGVPGEPAQHADANVAKTIAARLVLAGKRVKAVVHSDAHRRIEAEVAAHRLGFAEGLLIVDDELAMPWKVVAGLDAAIAMGPTIPRSESRPPRNLMPILWTMAAQLPVVVERDALAMEIINDDHTGLLIDPGDVNAACERLGRLIDDRAFASTIGKAAAQRMRERHDPAASCEQLQQVYTKASGTRHEAPGRRVPGG